MSGLVIVDKPGGMTSHDVVARIRRLAGTRRVGHAGTLDPMATGVLVVGVEKATRMLGYLALTEKQYDATIRLGESTSTDDAEGEFTGGSSAAGVSAGTLARAVGGLTGQIRQVPPAVSAIKVGGQRAYRLARAGEAPALEPRTVTVYAFAVTAVRAVQGDRLLDVDATVRCSSGTYVRALARDLGTVLGTGGHLTRLRRTRVGGYGLDAARTLDQLAERFEVLPLAQAAAVAFPRRDLSADEARRLAHGGCLAPASPADAASPASLTDTTGPASPTDPASLISPIGTAAPASLADAASPVSPTDTAGPASPTDTAGPASPADAAGLLSPPAPDTAGPVAAYAPDGTLIALVTEESGQARPLVVFA